MTDSKKPRRRATYDDLVQVPEHMIAEIIDGVLYTSPRPAFRHARTGSRLGVDLGPFDEGGGDIGGWWILDEPELHFGEDVLVPDLAGWRVERMPEFPMDAKFSTLAPDWVCEVPSPSTARLDRRKKLPVYARERVRYLWLPDPIARTVEILVLDGSQWTLAATHGAGDRIRAVPFEGVEIALSSLWFEPRTSARAEP